MKYLFTLLCLLPILGIVIFFAPYVFFRLYFPSTSCWLRFNPEELIAYPGLSIGFIYGLILNLLCLIWFGIARYLQIKYNFKLYDFLVLVVTLMLYVLTLTLDFSTHYIAWLLD